MTASLDWLGCATFRLRIGRLVVFLDAYIDRVPSAPPVGTSVAEIDRADWIIVGHSHFDHLYGAERIALQTEWPSIGSPKAATYWVTIAADSSFTHHGKGARPRGSGRNEPDFCMSLPGVVIAPVW